MRKSFKVLILILIFGLLGYGFTLLSMRFNNPFYSVTNNYGHGFPIVISISSKKTVDLSQYRIEPSPLYTIQEVVEYIVSTTNWPPLVIDSIFNGLVIFAVYKVSRKLQKRNMKSVD